MNDAPAMQLVEIASITPYAKNSRTHSDAQIEDLAKSIDEFGLVGGIVVRNGVIAKGHGTLSAVNLLRSRGEQIYPAPGKANDAQAYPDGMIPVLDASGWSDAQFKAYVIADNRIAESANWDWDLLSTEVFDLSTTEIDLTILGFDDKEFDLIQSVGEQRRGERKENNSGSAQGDLQIVISCENEEQQRELLDRFLSEGLTCRALM